MKVRWVVLPTALVVLGLIAITAADDAKAAKAAKAASPQSPIYGVPVPDGYRGWELIAPAREAAPFDELRVVLGNDIAVRAYRKSTLPFPDGSVLVKLAWKEVRSPDFASATIPGAATTVQVMVKDSKKYAASAGWGFGRFIGGVPVDEAQHRTCFTCHESRVKDRDFVLTHYSP